MTSQEYWALVTETQEGLKADHKRRVASFQKKPDAAAFEGQPEDGSGLYIVSRKSTRLGTVAGAISLAPFRLAAKSIVDESHEIATPEQIAAYLAAEAKRLAHYNKLEDALAAKYRPRA